MKTLVVDAAKIRETPSDEWEGLNALRGESAYEIAKRRGYTGTEAQWMNALETERAAAVASIETKRASAENSIETKGAATLNSIPDNYTQLTTQVGNIDSALKSGNESDAAYHLGFYLDGEGDLCQIEED